MSSYMMCHIQINSTYSRHISNQSINQSIETICTRLHSSQPLPPPRHIKFGSTSLRRAAGIYIGLNFLALRRNWFSQFRFHFSHQSTTGLFYKYDKVSRMCCGWSQVVRDTRYDASLREKR